MIMNESKISLLLNEEYNPSKWDKSIYYIAVPYKSNKALAVRYSPIMTKYLIQQGKFPFSPILHTHHFDEYWEFPDVDYPSLDIGILDNIIENEGLGSKEYRRISTRLVMTFPALPGQWGEWEPYFGRMSDWRDSEGCMKEFNWASNFIVNEIRIACISLPKLLLEKKWAFYTYLKD